MAPVGYNSTKWNNKEHFHSMEIYGLWLDNDITPYHSFIYSSDWNFYIETMYSFINIADIYSSLIGGVQYFQSFSHLYRLLITSSDPGRKKKIAIKIQLNLLVLTMTSKQITFQAFTNASCFHHFTVTVYKNR